MPAARALTISVVVPHYFPERDENLPVLLGALLGGALVPLEILIWNNNPAPPPLAPDPRVHVIHSPRNVGCQARFLAALLARGDLVVFQDNDACARPETLGELVAAHARWPEAVLTLDGRQMAERRVRHWPRVRAHDGPDVIDVDVSLGRFELVPRRRLPRLLEAFPFEESTRQDDLWFSHCVRAQCVAILVPPNHGFIDLPTRGRGASTGPDKLAFYADRHAVAARLFSPEVVDPPHA
jgi:hypothetical protein